METKRYHRNYTEDERARMKITGAAIQSAMEDYVAPNGIEGISFSELAAMTGMTVAGLRNHANGTTLPGRATLAFILDVLGVGPDDERRIRGLKAASPNHNHSHAMKKAMTRFYGTPFATPVAAPPATNGVYRSDRRTKAIEAMIDQMSELVDVSVDDVIDWLDDNGHTLDSDAKDRIMRALWAPRG